MERQLFAIDLAMGLNGEIISGDSQQVYRKLDIGTAKATPEEQAAAPSLDRCAGGIESLLGF